MIIRSDFWNEQYSYYKLNNGLEVFLLNKADFKKTFCYLAVNYGSLDNEFIPPFQNEYVRMPYGIAHFLEHQMFENNQNINAEFTKFCAECNAFTSFDRTTYAFSSCQNIIAPLELLLDFVQKPNYNNKTIEKERSIILQELMMYEDNPQIMLFQETLNAMYKQTDIRIDICGTEESIKEINKKHLDLCYETFYHPSNMCLVVVGPINEQEILETIENNQNKKKFREYVKIHRKYPEEISTVKEKKVVKPFNLTVPKLAIGIKLPSFKKNSLELLRKDLSLSMLVDYNFDETSDFYELLLEKQLLNDTYGYETQIDDGFSYCYFSLDSYRYNEVIELIKSKLLNLSKLTEEEFIRYKNTIIASNIRKMNSLEYYGTSLVDGCFCNLTLFRIMDEINNITLEDVNSLIEYFNDDNISVVVIKDAEDL